VLGTAKLGYPYLLPSELTDARPDVVKIGKLEAYRNSRVKAGAAKSLYTFFILPQDGKSMTTAAVCFSKSGSPSPLQDCERVVSGITVAGTKSYDLVPSAKYANNLSAALRTLTQSRTAGMRKLKAAKTAAAQAKAARQIGGAYSSVAARVRGAHPPAYAKPKNDAIVAELGSAASAYGLLASAAAAKSSARYAAARRKATAAEKRLSEALAHLGLLGYSVG
jgi:hypothetical protein